MKRPVSKYILAAICSLLFTLTYAGKETSVASVKLQATGNPALTVEDNKYQYMVDNAPTATQPGWKGSFLNSSDDATTFLCLKIDRYAASYQKDPFTATVEVAVSSYPIPVPGQTPVPVTETKKLQVTYALDGPYKDKHFIYVQKGYKMSVTVTSVTLNPEYKSAFPVNLVLEGGIEVSRNYNIGSGFSLPSAFNFLHNPAVNTTSGELEVYWDYAPGAESYEVEWSYVEAYKEDKSLRPAQEVEVGEFSFRNNSSRVEVSANSYRIPLIYEKGYLVYRVRGKRTEKDGTVRYTGWSFTSTGITLNKINNYYTLSGHEQGLNWQNTLLFSEEGKNKSVISYYDGSLRKRQSVTKLNSQKQTIVGEIIYDHEGRGVINVLPAPTNDSVLRYYPYFSLKNSSTATNKVPYDREDFDFDNQCKTTTQGMSTLDGASRYYSKDNPNKKDQQAYLPDAQLKPFVQTEYTSDNTGRIKRHGGPGETLAIGNGHEAKYDYKTPTQQELDELFGFEAGYSSHYKKNISRDANGQVTVTYVDSKGKTIATFLQGKNPSNLDKLDSNGPSADRVENLLDQSNGISKNKKIGSSLVLADNVFVDQQGDRTFDYSLTFQNYQRICEKVGNQVCYTPVFDVIISLLDECGQPVSLSDGAKSYLEYTATAGSFNTSCALPAAFSSELKALNLAPGSYTITKTLRINEEALDKYIADYTKNYACIDSEDKFIDKEVSGIDNTCELTCDQCSTRVAGKHDQYVGPNCTVCITEDEYQQMLKDCYKACGTEPVDCKAAYEAMLGDVSPYSQYGEVLAKDAQGQLVWDPSKNPLSVYYESNSLPRKSDWPSNIGAPHWRYPYNPDQPDDKKFIYITQDMSGAWVESLIEVKKTDPSDPSQSPTYTPAVTDPAKLKTFSDKPGRYFINPKDLLNVKDFVDSWRHEWAYSLVHFHPEYCYYDFCNGNANSQKWDLDFQRTKSYNDAVSKGIISGNALPNPVSDAVGDPFFRTTSPFSNKVHDQARSAMLGDMSTYIYNKDIGKGYSIWQLAYVNIFCPNSALPNSICPVDASCPPANTALNFASFGDNTKLWDQFKELYLTAKKRNYYQRATYYAISKTCYNGCIGDSSFTPYKDEFIRFPISNYYPLSYMDPLWDWFNSQYYNSAQPCYWGSYDLYKGKIKRFPGSNDVTKEKDYRELCNDQTDGLFKPISCSEKSEVLLDAIDRERNFEYYEKCGQCPLAMDLEHLLNAIAMHPVHTLSTSQFNLSCYPDSDYPEFTPAIANALNFQGTSEVVWQNVSKSNDEIVSRFAQLNGGGTCKISLSFTGLHDDFILDSVRSFCCIEYITNPTHYPLQAGRNFTIVAQVANKAPLGAGKVVKEFVLEGVTECLNIGNCTAPVTCNTYGVAAGVQSLFNTLLLVTAKKPNQIAAANVDLSVTPYKESITPSFKASGPSGSKWKWTGTVSGGTLQGVISDELSHSCMIELTIPANENFGFSDIVKVLRLQVDSKSTSPSNNFIVFAIVNDPVLKTTRTATLKGFSGSCFTLGACKTAVIKRQ